MECILLCHTDIVTIGNQVLHMPIDCYLGNHEIKIW